MTSRLKALKALSTSRIFGGYTHHRDQFEEHKKELKRRHPKKLKYKRQYTAKAITVDCTIIDWAAVRRRREKENGSRGTRRKR